MFKDVYRSANNSINPPPELIEKVLSQKPKKKLHYYSAAKAAAVCLIFSGTVLLYPKISKDLETTKEETIIRPEVTQTALPDVPVHTEVVMEDIATPAPTQQATAKPATPPPKQAKPEVTPSPVPTPSETDAAVEDNSKIAQNNSIAVASETSEAITPEPVYPAEEEIIPEASGGGGGGSSGGASMMKSRMAMISEKEAIAIADNEFLSDFGEEFVNSSELTVVYDNGYTVTRKTTEIEASILISDNGSFEKLY